jgi:hypothetical protein
MCRIGCDLTVFNGHHQDKKTMTYGTENSNPALGQTQKSDGVKSVYN